jgi:hypothetical protein
MILDNTRVKKWSDLVDVFLRQYKFNVDIAPDRTSLMVMKKSNKKIVREYAHRWKDKGNACTTTFVKERDDDSIHQYFQVFIL